MSLRQILPLALIGVVLAAAVGGARAQAAGPATPAALAGTGFTYQGQLSNDSGPVSAGCDFQFSLHDAATLGSQLGSTQTLTNVAVANGLFTVVVNSGGEFGAGAFDGSARWLGIAVRCPTASGAFTPLSPRQALTPAPLALALPGLRTEQNATSPNVVGGHISNTVGLTRVGVTIGGGGQEGLGHNADANYATIGGGTGNVVSPTAAYGTVAGGIGNVASGLAASVGGGGYDGNLFAGNRAEGNASTVAGGFANHATTNYATIAGGGQNRAHGWGAAIGGGASNTISDTAMFGTIGGGSSNVVGGEGATVGGGGWDGSLTGGNMATGNASTVAGGWGNTASGFYASVGGGANNAATGNFATVPGGGANTAAGINSLAAGASAHAGHNGAFVWNSTPFSPAASGAENQFVVSAAGGIYFDKGQGGLDAALPDEYLIGTGSGAYLDTSGVWVDVSDANAKTAFAPLSGPGLLAALMRLDIQSWAYKTDAAGARHIGPTAQDFHAAFGVGASDTHLAALDTSGVALAAVQQVYAEVQAQQAHIAALEARLAALEAAPPPRAPAAPALPWLLLGGLGLLNLGGLAGYALARGKRG